MKRIFVFAGQGSQFYGMGARLYREEEAFRKHLDAADGIVREITGRAVGPVMMDESRRGKEKFDDLSVSSYAIFLFEYAAARMLMDYGVLPDATVGCSLGELASQVIAGAMTPEEAVRQIRRHESVFRNIRADSCCMLAVGLPENELNPADCPGCEVISVSHDRQFVLSGPEEGIRVYAGALRRREAPFLELPVNFPFHTALMDAYREPYLRQMEDLGLGMRRPVREMISCSTGRPVTTVDDPFRWNILRGKIRWVESIRLLASPETLFVDCSADGELAASLRRLLPGNKNIYGISSPFNTGTPVSKTAGDILAKGGIALKAYVFPGQGSQQKGMGGELFDAFPELTGKADEILGYSIRDLCLNDPDGVLDNTRYTQPALYTVCALGYLKKLQDGEAKPDFVAGHSLGEYAALFASGAVDFETGLRLVKKRGELMSLAEGGGMAAVVGLTQEKVAEVLSANGLADIDIANLNTPTQIVLSGPKDSITKAEPYFTAAEGCMMYKVLNVSGAFHSRYMSKAREEFDETLKSCRFREPEIPILANVTAWPYRPGEAAALLSEQLVSPVHWTDTIRYLMALNVDTIEEIGPGHVAAGMVRQIRRMAEPLDLANTPEPELRKPLAAEPEAAAVPAKAEPAPEKEEAPAGGAEPLAERLGSAAFRKDYGLKYSYCVGSMGYGISGTEVIRAAAGAGLLAIAGTDGMTPEEIRILLHDLRGGRGKDAAFAVHLAHDASDARETAFIDLYLQEDAPLLAVSGYSAVTRSLVRYRLHGLTGDASGRAAERNRILAFVSRTDTAESFLSPPPERIVASLLERGEITEEEARLAPSIPLCRDVCVEADGGGATNRTPLFAVLPAVRAVAARLTERYGYREALRVGVSGGIGTGAAAAAAFLLGADFIVTGSVNQCTAESRTSDAVKDLLAGLRVQDVGYVNAGDVFDPERAFQVVKKGTLFKARADRLVRLMRRDSPTPEDGHALEQLAAACFGQPPEAVLSAGDGTASGDPAAKLLARYLDQSLRWAIEGDPEQATNYQIPCGPALGAFNEWVRGTELEDRKNRTIAAIAEKIMEGAADTIRGVLGSMV